MHANRFALNMHDDPEDSVPRLYRTYGSLWAMRDRPLHMRIVSHDFPWVIDIKVADSPDGSERGITCGDVWSQLYSELLEPIHDSDWAHLTNLATRDAGARQRHQHLIRVARRQVSRGEDVSLVRLDWLMTKTVFVGLEKDEGYSLAAQRLLPGKERCDETWVAYFSEAR